MARQSRYHVSGAFYHVLLRGNNGQKIFFDDIDRCRICLLIQQGIEKYDHRIHAFCLMSNHIHLLIQVGHIHLSKILHNLAFRYSQGFNKRYQKRGHVFQGRFKAILLSESGYFLKLLRYIHMNPVRAKLVNDPESYKWSGHKAYLGEEEITWLTVEYALTKFKKTLGEARKLYNDFILKEESNEELEEIRKGFKDGQILGDDNFLDEIRKTHGKETEASNESISLLAIVEAACDVFGVEKSMLLSISQRRNISLARGAIVKHAQERGLTLDEIGAFLKRDRSTLSRLGDRFLLKHRNCMELQKMVEKMRQIT
jgi:putative transposase